MMSTGESVRLRIMVASSVAGVKQKSVASIVSPCAYLNSVQHSFCWRVILLLRPSTPTLAPRRGGGDPLGEGKAVGSKSQLPVLCSGHPPAWPCAGDAIMPVIRGEPQP